MPKQLKDGDHGLAVKGKENDQKCGGHRKRPEDVKSGGPEWSIVERSGVERMNK